jgi:hypothetical protein
MVKSFILSFIYNARYNLGWLFFLIGFIGGGMMMIHVLEEEGLL